MGRPAIPGHVKMRTAPPVARPGTLHAPCWCDSHFFAVPTADVRAGKTVSCGAPDCKPPS